MRSSNIIITFIFFIAMFFKGFSQNSTTHSITVTQLNSEMTTDTSLVILDVRNPGELTGPLGHIDGVINIPLPELESRLQELDKFKDKNIAVICRSGRRSGIATDLLVKKGFSAKNVLGGMLQYRKEKGEE